MSDGSFLEKEHMSIRDANIVDIFGHGKLQTEILLKSLAKQIGYHNWNANFFDDVNFIFLCWNKHPVKILLDQQETPPLETMNYKRPINSYV